MKKIVHGDGSPSLRTEYGYLTRVVQSEKQEPDPKKEILIKEIEKIIEIPVDRIVEVIKEVIVEKPVLIEKLIEKEVIVEKPVDRIVEVQKIVEKQGEPVVRVIEIEKPVEKFIEIEKLVNKMPSWAKILLFGETLLIILGVIKCLK